MRKGSDGEEKRKKKEKIMTFLEATNVVASRPPKRRPTGTPTARANLLKLLHLTYFPKTISYELCNLTYLT